MMQRQATAVPDLRVAPSVVQAAPVANEGEHPWPPRQGEWTYEEWLRLPDDGWQYEVIKGVLCINPAPTTIHQRISRNLEFALWLFTRQEQAGEVFYAPTDVYLPGQETPVQPDLLFITAGRQDIISERGIEGAPDLVVEILSPPHLVARPAGETAAVRGDRRAGVLDSGAEDKDNRGTRSARRTVCIIGALGAGGNSPVGNPGRV